MCNIGTLMWLSGTLMLRTFNSLLLRSHLVLSRLFVTEALESIVMFVRLRKGLEAWQASVLTDVSLANVV